MIVFFNGKFLNESKIGISINNRSFRYGDGFFETIKYGEGKVLGWFYHIDRLLKTLQALHFETPSYLTSEYLESGIHDLVKRNGHFKLARVRITIFRGDGGIYDAVSHKPQILIQSWSLNPENNKLNENGLVTGFYTGGFKAADAFANLKTNNFLLYAMAALWAKQNRLNDAIVLNHENMLADTTIANLWMIKDDIIFTPPLSDGPVAGTMRAFLLETFPALGWNVVEKSLSKTLFLEAEEIFFSNAIYGIKWVRMIENREFACKKIQSIHIDLKGVLNLPDK